MQPVSRTLETLALWHQITVQALHRLPYDLSSRQIAIMLTVYMGGQSHTVKSLTDTLRISKPAICRALDTLSKDGLIKRKKDDTDRRTVFIQRTLKGSLFLSDYAEIINEASISHPLRQVA